MHGQTRPNGPNQDPQVYCPFFIAKILCEPVFWPSEVEFHKVQHDRLVTLLRCGAFELRQQRNLAAGLVVQIEQRFETGTDYAAEQFAAVAMRESRANRRTA